MVAVVTNFPNICWSEKDLISPLLMMFSLTEYEIHGGNFFPLIMLYLFYLVEFLLRGPLNF